MDPGLFSDIQAILAAPVEEHAKFLTAQLVFDVHRRLLADGLAPDAAIFAAEAVALRVARARWLMYVQIGA